MKHVNESKIRCAVCRKQTPHTVYEDYIMNRKVYVSMCDICNKTNSLEGTNVQKNQ